MRPSLFIWMCVPQHYSFPYVFQKNPVAVLYPAIASVADIRYHLQTFSLVFEIQLFKQVISVFELNC